MNTPGLTEQSLRQLVEAGEAPCVSIYIPLNPDGTDREQATIRLKNQLDRATKALKTRGMDARESESLLAPLRAMTEPEVLPVGGAVTLAFFRSPGMFETFGLPEATPETAVVNDTFHVKPLLALVNADSRFRLLALTQNEVRVYEGGRYHIAPVEVPELPESLSAALRYDDDDDDETIQFHTGDASNAGDRPAVFHGQVSTRDEHKDSILRFCQLVDNAVSRHFENHDIPLLLAAPEPLPGIYRQANSYPNLHEQVISGDPRWLSDEALHTQAWEIVAPEIERRRAGAVSTLHEALAKDRASTDLGNVLAAAENARVDTIFVATDVQRSKPSATPAGGSPPTLPPDPVGEERINQAVVKTLRHGGHTVGVALEQMPHAAPVAALYRY